MFKLSRPLAISSNCSPVIGPSDIFMDSCVYHGLDSEDMAWLHEPSGLVAGVVRHVWCTMEEGADSMSTISSIH